MNSLAEDKSIERLLLIRLRNIGDVLLMVPAVRAFRQAWPRAFICALVNAGTEEMLSGNPLLNEILIFDPRWKDLPGKEGLRRQVSFLRDVRRRRFDLAVNFTDGDRGAFLCLASGARHKWGLLNPRDRGLWWKKRVFSRMVEVPDWRAHMVEQALEIPRAMGLETEGKKKVEIFFSPEDEAQIDRLLQEERGGGGPWVHIHPTSRWLFKCWRDDGMAKVIQRLQEEAGVRVVLTSGKERREMEKIASILRLCRSAPVSLAGKTTLKQLAALSRRSLLFIGVDTAPMHIAAAVGTPVLALFGPSGEFNWGPWGDGHVVIKKDMECRPCGQDGCGGSKKSRCLEEITEEEVLEAAIKLLRKSETGEK